MNNFRIKTVWAAMACMAVSPAFARQLTPEEALQDVVGKFRLASTRSGLEPIYTEKAAGMNVAYVFPAFDAEGYVVAAADDLLPAVLGYSYSGAFDVESMPPAMKYWLEEYGRQLDYAAANGLKAPAAVRAADHPSIAPLCEATWNQSSPFNDNCPAINGKKAPAGCTATAMAQVMYAHRWPVKGNGSNTYLSGTSREQLTFDFGATTFDWSHMLPSYSSGYSEAQGAAVATLLEACGNAALMTYGASASGAYPYDAIYGMVKFMGYDRSAVMLERDYYTAAVWDETVYAELAAGRPVIYGGYDASYKNGHTFVVDGYSGDGYYHLNWGWGGKSDGYFLLTALDPKDQGIGGTGSGGYNFRQDAIINVMPSREGSDCQLEVMWYGPFTTSRAAYTSVGEVEFTVGGDGEFKAFTLEDAHPTMGVRLTPTEGGEPVFYPAVPFDFPSHYGEYAGMGYKSFTIPVADFPKTGNYTVTPAFRTDDTVKDVAVKVGETRRLLMTCSAMGVKFETPATDRTLTADDITPGGKLYSGKACSVSADIHNSGEEYLGMVKAGFVNPEGQVRAWLSDVPVNITDGETVKVTFTGVLNSYNSALPAGRYTLNVYDEAGECISPKPLGVEVLETPVGKPVIGVTLTLSGNESGDGSSLNPYLIGDDVEMEVKVDVVSGFFDDTVALYAYYDANNEVDFTDSSVSYQTFFAGPGESQTQTYRLGTSDFEMDRTAYIRAYGWTSDWSAESLGWMGRTVYVKRTTSGVSAIEAGKSRLYPNPAVDFATVEASSEIRSVEVYSLTGMRMLTAKGNGGESLGLDVSGLPAGHYVVTVRTADGMERHRMVKL